MKTKLLFRFILPVLVLLCGLFGCHAPERSAEPYGVRAISHFFFTESGGLDFDDRTSYALDYADGFYTAVIKPSGVKNEKARTVRVDADFADRLAAILEEFGVGAWDGFRETDDDVMDGIGFTLDVTFTDGRKIDAMGYMMWPAGYDDAVEAFHALFGEAYLKRR